MRDYQVVAIIAAIYQHMAEVVSHSDGVSDGKAVEWAANRLDEAKRVAPVATQEEGG